LITNALADYAKITGIDLSNNPFAIALEQSSSPEAILQLIQEREKAFKEYRDGNRRLITSLRPAVNVIQAFSGILGEAVSLVSREVGFITLFKQTSSGTLPTSEGFVCWDRRSPRCTSLEYTPYPFSL
jgi:fungal STAND N-terminal Goodbye domain